MLYWDLGKQITEKQENVKWGSGFIEQLSKDLREEFPEMKGFSVDNLTYMKKFYLFYTQESEQVVPKLGNQFIAQLVQQIENSSQISEQVVRKSQPSDNDHITISAQVVRKLALVPWGHHTTLLRKIKDINQALFYINKTIENNWSRAVLEYQIETNLYGRQGKSVTNFSQTLPAPQSDLANEIMKDPYNFDLYGKRAEKYDFLQNNTLQSHPNKMDKINKEHIKQAVYDIVCLIPCGRATSYGAIAKAAGFPNLSRMVGKIMSQCDSALPAHRVVNNQGLLSGSRAFGNSGEMQKLLESEGITIVNNKIKNLKNVFWNPLDEIC